MDYANLLLNAINNYNDNDATSKLVLRDLVCIISDSEVIKKDNFIKTLLYIASQKMRVFGYNIQNGFQSDPDTGVNILSLVSNESLKQNYRSQVRKNNILDKTQKEIIDFFQSLPIKRMLVSAPTSYGKTFIMREILFLNRYRYNNALLVFPTVALLRENAENLETLNRDLQMGYSVIKSVDNEFDICARNIFVFTPERAMQLLANFPALKLDFFFYDEMYKIDEDFCYDETDEKDELDKAEPQKKFSRYNVPRNFLDEARAKTFRICLYLLAKQVPEYYLAGPNLSEKHFGFGMRQFLNSNNIQLRAVTFEPTRRIRVDAYSAKITEHTSGLPLESIEDGRATGKVGERICAVVDYITRNNYGQTLLYCTTPAKANEYASTLAANDQGKQISDKDYMVFLEHIKRTYNVNGSISHWSFLNVLKKGFAMHHGKLPKYIQKEVLDLFNRGLFDLLFCTSTIVEGVNTNAKNMVVLNHTKGATSLTGFDLKNIIGRAGRYYHNFLGRYFLFDKELVSIADAEDLTLDFVTYSTREIDAIDLDNTEMPDLAPSNQQIKVSRILQQRNYNLPESVFIQNRLVRKELQEKLLNYLIINDQDFNSFFSYLKFQSILDQFIKYPAFNTILKIFQAAGLLDEMTVKFYTAISISYTKEGFYGILKYQINQAEKGDIKYDSAYSKAFKTQKDIIEHKIPKILALFESIFICAASIKGINIGNFSLSKVIRFYETGVRSYFGEQLIEFGFPIDTIRKLEDKCPLLISLGNNDVKIYVQNNMVLINSWLDEYEKRLLKRAMKSFN